MTDALRSRRWTVALGLVSILLWGWGCTAPDRSGRISAGLALPPSQPPAAEPAAAPAPTQALTAPAAITVPSHLRPVVIASPEDNVPSYVVVEARFQRVVSIGEGDQPTLFLEFRPPADAPGDVRWHTMWFRPCEPNEAVNGFVQASLGADQRVQIALAVNPSGAGKGQLTAHCQAGGYRTPAEAADYAASVFATNLQTLRGEDAGIYLGGSLNSLVRLPAQNWRANSIIDSTSTLASTSHSSLGAAASSPSSSAPSSKADSTSSASNSS